MWICHTCTGVIEAEPMITADENAAIIDLAGAERREAMRTAILDRSDLADRITKQGHGCVEDGASDNLAGTEPSSEEHTSEIQALKRSPYEVHCVKRTTTNHQSTK